MTNISTIAQNQFIRARLLEIQSQMNTLTEQISSGKKSTVFSGISEVSSLSLQLNNVKKTTDEFIANITKARTRTQPIQATLQRIADIAAELRNSALTATGDGLPFDKGNGALKALAQERVNEIASLLNIKIGSDYLFSGRQTGVPPMRHFGSIGNASSILGQVAALNSSYALTSATSGEIRYDAIKDFLANGITKQTPGGSAPAPYGYQGETGAPGGSDFRFTVETAAAAGATSVIVEQGFDLPEPGQYIEFGTTQEHNAAYLVTAVNATTRQIDFTRVPATATGLDFAVSAGTSLNVSRPAGVTTLEAAGTAGADSTFGLDITTGGGVGATTIDVADGTRYTVGNVIQFDNHSATYTISGIAGNTLTLDRQGGGGGLTSAVAGTEAIRIVPGAFGSATSGNQLRVNDISQYTVGDRLLIGADYYDVTNVDAATQTIAFERAPHGGGLAAAVTAGDAITIEQGYAPGTTIVTLGSTTGVEAGMALKFSNSSSAYTVVAVLAGNQVQIQSTSSGGSASGLQEFVPPPIAGTAGMEVTAAFGEQVDPLQVRVDTGMDLEYGVRADDPAIRHVLNALFALATTDLNTTTEAGFRRIAQLASDELSLGLRQVSDLQSTLGVKENVLDATEQRHSDFLLVLETQIDRVENVDVAEAVTKLTQTQAGLEASYKLLASLRELSLANFI
jgi:flagellin-like hook-associated protein FlgL